MRKPKFYYYDKVKCEETAKQCVNRREFYIKFCSAYKSAKQNGWLNEFFPPKKKEKDFWTYEKCKIESLKYVTKKELKNKNETVYKKILKNGWDKLLFAHMKSLGNIKKRLIYSQEFSDNSVYVGLTGDIDKRSKNHVNLKKETVYKHIEKTGLTPKLKKLTDYLPINVAIEKEKEFLNLYKKNNWQILNKTKTGGIGKTKTKWTIDTVLVESMKYKTKTEFKKNSYNAYCVMYKLKCQDIVCSHMEKKDKKIIQLSISGELIDTYDSINIAHKKTGVRYSTILSCCKGVYNTGEGYRWSYLYINNNEV